MSPLNSTKLTNVHFTTSQNNITITVHKCSAFFSFFFNLCTVYYTKECLFFSFFFFHMLCLTVFKFLFLSSPVLFPLSCTFLVLFSFFLIFYFHNKLLIHCPFFSNLISTSLCLYLNTITIGSLPSLFNFNHSTIN